MQKTADNCRILRRMDGCRAKGGEVSGFWWKIIICAINKHLRDGDFGFED